MDKKIPRQFKIKNIVERSKCTRLLKQPSTGLIVPFTIAVAILFKKMENGDWWNYVFLLSSPAFLTMTMRKRKMAIAGIMSSCWVVLLSWPWPWENGRWRWVELCLLFEESCLLDHVMEDGGRVVYQVCRGVELHHLPLVQHQNPARPKSGDRSLSSYRCCSGHGRCCRAMKQ